MSRSFTTSLERARKFLYREKQFSCHVSHELRTPLAIISNSISLLKLEHASSDVKAAAIARIDSAAGNMAQLIETFLLLGREQQSSNICSINLRQAIFNEFEKTDSLGNIIQPKSKLQIVGNGIVQSDPVLLGILVNNLLRNAIASSKDQVSITLSEQQILIDNSIASAQDIAASGFGYGTEIMQRIADSLDCQLTVTKTDDRYRVRVDFNHL